MHTHKIVNNQPTSRTDLRQRTSLLKAILFMSLIWAVPAIACGSFAPRATPTPTASTTVLQVPESQATDAQTGSVTTANQPETTINAGGTPLAIAPTVTPVPQATPTFTATPEPGTAVSVGQPARIVAPYGLNIRANASANAQLITQLGTGQLVSVLEGPISADGYTWWKIEDSAGNSGWGVDGDGENTWITPNVGTTQPVNRQPRVNERVRVSMPGDLQLTVRSLPGTDAPVLIRVDSGTEFSVVDGPRSADGYTWFRIRSDDGNIAGWAADADNTQSNRWLSPLE